MAKSNHKPTRGSIGFSLIELTCVMAIMATMLAIATAAVANKRRTHAKLVRRFIFEYLSSDVRATTRLL